MESISQITLISYGIKLVLAGLCATIFSLGVPGNLNIAEIRFNMISATAVCVSYLLFDYFVYSGVVRSVIFIVLIMILLIVLTVISSVIIISQKGSEKSIWMSGSLWMSGILGILIGAGYLYTALFVVVALLILIHLLTKMRTKKT